ncbi:hypothetical protein EFQ56_09040, partial [Limosilactobacillus fermentum]|nr:hypothetical protein [Limosilactobacillus fermentum]
FPTAIRQTIYSTNLIESFNKSLKKMVRRKSSQTKGPSIALS